MKNTVLFLLIQLLIWVAGCSPQEKEQVYLHEDSINLSEQLNKCALNNWHEKDYDSALILFDSALLFDPKNIDVEFNRCQLFGSSGDIWMGMVEVTKFMNDHPEKNNFNADLKFVYADYYCTIREYKVAQRIIEKCIRELISIGNTSGNEMDSSRISDAYYSLSWYYLNQNKADSAILASKNALLYNKNASYIFVLQGVAYTRLSMQDSANYYFSQALRNGVTKETKDLISKEFLEDTSSPLIKYPYWLRYIYKID